LSATRILWGRTIPELIYLFLILLPGLMPFVASVTRFFAAGTKYSLAYRFILVALVFAASVAMTNQAYHIGSSYEALPQIDSFLWVGLGWALISAMPSLVAIILNNRDLRGAALTGAMISLPSLVILTPLNFWLTVMLSFE